MQSEFDTHVARRHSERERQREVSRNVIEAERVRQAARQRVLHDELVMQLRAGCEHDKAMRREYWYWGSDWDRGQINEEAWR